MINYIVQVILFQTLFLFVYDAFLSKETFFAKNRWYLLGTSLLSFVIPFVRIPQLKETVPGEIHILLPEIVLSPQTVIEQSTPLKESISYGTIIFWIGLSAFLFLFLFKLYKLISLIRFNRIQKKSKYTFVYLPQGKKAFSFFNFIFLGDQILEEERNQIIAHELVHVRQKHSLDLLLFETLKIVMWFNPLIYIYQKRIATVHEYISDEMVTTTTNKSDYVNQLVNELFDVQNFSFVNQFFIKSLIKKRIKMLSKEKSKRSMLMKYLVIIPLLASMLFYISCSEEVELKGQIVAEKKESKMLMLTEDGLKEFTGGGDKYLDVLIGFSDDIPDNWKVISEKDLLTEERIEYDEFMNRVTKVQEENSRVNFTYKLLRNDEGRGIIGMFSSFNSKIKNFITDSKFIEESNETIETIHEDVPFSIIDKVPTFPGCPENDKDCFNRKMQMHFGRNFDPDFLKNSGLSSGKKRLIMLFKIDKVGNVVDVRVKAPAPKLKEEAERIINLLPKMKPGEHNGETVGVKYTLPMRIDVE